MPALDTNSSALWSKLCERASQIAIYTKEAQPEARRLQDDGSFLRGLFWAFALEAVAIMAGSILVQAWHFLGR